MPRSVLALAFFCLAGVGFFPAMADISSDQHEISVKTTLEINNLLQIDLLLATMSVEAVGELVISLDPEGGQGDSGALRINLERIYDPERLSRLMTQALSREIATKDPRIIHKALRFYDSPLGRRIVGLEISARRALLEPDQAAAADEALAVAQERDDPRLEQIERLMALTDIVETGVVTGLNGNIQTTRGLFAAIGERPDPGIETADAAIIEQQLRADISQWVPRLLLLAYGPIGDDDLDLLIAQIQTPEAQILSDCLDRAFDAVFMRLSFEVGIISGAALGGEEI